MISPSSWLASLKDSASKVTRRRRFPVGEIALDRIFTPATTSLTGASTIPDWPAFSIVLNYCSQALRHDEGERWDLLSWEQRGMSENFCWRWRRISGLDGNLVLEMLRWCCRRTSVTTATLACFKALFWMPRSCDGCGRVGMAALFPLLHVVELCSSCKICREYLICKKCE